MNFRRGDYTAVALKGAGRERDYYGIKKWLFDQRLTIRAVAKMVGKHHTAVSQVIRGLQNNRVILRQFLDLGCPADILSLPADMKEQANEG